MVVAVIRARQHTHLMLTVAYTQRLLHVFFFTCLYLEAKHSGYKQNILQIIE